MGREGAVGQLMRGEDVRSRVVQAEAHAPLLDAELLLVALGPHARLDLVLDVVLDLGRREEVGVRVADLGVLVKRRLPRRHARPAVEDRQVGNDVDDLEVGVPVERGRDDGLVLDRVERARRVNEPAARLEELHRAQEDAQLEVVQAVAVDGRPPAPDQRVLAHRAVARAAAGEERGCMRVSARASEAAGKESSGERQPTGRRRGFGQT